MGAPCSAAPHWMGQRREFGPYSAVDGSPGGSFKIPEILEHQQQLSRATPVMKLLVPSMGSRTHIQSTP
jgi:hypothetical protein